ncbi:hypothetical protein KJ713_00630 [Patescibacteria group bacterium]|nr:hypothetical protein [Patescibacteria group bacterium]
MIPKLIKNQIKKNTFSQAYLFYGPGRKNLMARKLIKKILGQERDKFLDLIIIKKPEDRTRILIDQIREVKRKLSLKSSGRRVVMIKRAELLSEDAANAFLKTLEEPSPQTIFILTASNIKQVLLTIISRCHNFYLPEGLNKKNHERAKRIKEFLAADLVQRFQLAKEIAEVKGKGARAISDLERFLRIEMLKNSDLKEKKRIAREIKKITGSRLLLKQNVSVRLILEDLSLRLRKR